MSLKSPWLEKKLVDPQHLKNKCEEIRFCGQTIVTLNGSFDLLHVGHLFILHEASLQADCLVVALNSDASIRQYKGPMRPVLPLQQRLAMIAALEFVHYVTWFEEEHPCTLLSLVKPHVHVNGEEYGANCVEASTVTKYGGRLHLVKRLAPFSTTALVEKLQKKGVLCG